MSKGEDETQVQLIDYPRDAAELFIQTTPGRQLPEDPDERRKLIDSEIKAKTAQQTETFTEKEIITVQGMIEDFTQVREEFTQKKLAKKTLKSHTDVNAKRYLHEMNWRTNPRSIFYRLSGLATHELGNLVNLPVGYIGLFVDDGFPEKIDPFTQEDILSHLDAGIEFLRVTEMAVENGDTEVTLDQFINTFSGSAERSGELELTTSTGQKVVFEGDIDKFDTYEEFLSVRTLLHNAIKEAKVTEIVISKGKHPGTRKTVYTVTDDGPTGKSFERYTKTVEKFLELGRKYPKAPGIVSSGGGGIIAFLAGQRGDDVMVSYDEEKGTKSVQVTFSGQN